MRLQDSYTCSLHLWSDHPRGLLIPDVNALILARCSSTVFPSVFINREFGMKVVEENSAIRMLQHYQKSLMEIWALLLTCQTEFFHFSLIFPNFKMLNKISKEMRMGEWQHTPRPACFPILGENRNFLGGSWPRNVNILTLRLSEI